MAGPLAIGIRDNSDKRSKISFAISRWKMDGAALSNILTRSGAAILRGRGPTLEPA